MIKIPEDWDGKTFIKNESCIACGSYCMFSNLECDLCILNQVVNQMFRFRTELSRMGIRITVDTP